MPSIIMQELSPELNYAIYSRTAYLPEFPAELFNGTAWRAIRLERPSGIAPVRPAFFSEIPGAIGKLESLRYLGIIRGGLKNLPENLSKLPLLTDLVLDENNFFAGLPAVTGQLPALRRLSLKDCQLKEFRITATAFTRLASLNLGRNQLQQSPEGMEHCPGLTSLDLSDNCFRMTGHDFRFPGEPESDFWEKILRLEKLESLCLSGLNITALPEEIGRLRNLRTLSVSNNLLEFLPGSIGLLSRLEKLDLSGNRLSSLPEGLSKLSQLRVLRIADNKFEKYPAPVDGLYRLERLEMDGNNISELPVSLASLPHLTIILTDSAKLNNVAPELSEKTYIRGYNTTTPVVHETILPFRFRFPGVSAERALRLFSAPADARNWLLNQLVHFARALEYELIPLASASVHTKGTPVSFTGSSQNEQWNALISYCRTAPDIASVELQLGDGFRQTGGIVIAIQLGFDADRANALLKLPSWICRMHGYRTDYHDLLARICEITDAVPDAG